MRGDIVIVRAFGDEPLERKVCEIKETVVLVSNPELFEKVEQGEAWPIGFPIEDVFQFDGALYKRLESAVRRREKAQLTRIWCDAKPYIEQPE